MSFLSWSSSSVVEKLPASAINAKADVASTPGAAFGNIPTLTAQGDLKKEDKSSPRMSLSVTPGTKRSLVAAMAHRFSMKPGSGKKGSIHPQTYKMSIMSGSQMITTNTGGLYSAFFGGANIQGSADFSALSSLFDIARVIGCSVHYQPIGYGSVPAASPAQHVPCFMAFDPESATNVSFLNMLSSRPLSEPQNKYANTSIPWHFSAKTESEKKVDPFFSTSTPTGPTMGEWTDSLPIAFTNMNGGFLLSVLTDTNNVSLNLGYFVIEWKVEWSTRL